MAEGNEHNGAAICVVRRLCLLVFAMLKNQEPYRQPNPKTSPKPLDSKR